MNTRILTAAMVVAALAGTAAAQNAPAPTPARTGQPTSPASPTAPAKPAGKPEGAKPDPAAVTLPKLDASVMLPRNEAVPAEKVKVDQKVLDEAVKRGVQVMLSLQEGDGKSEWPYEGVYRVRGEVPVGYRIGGTSIVASTLLKTPGFAEDGPRKAAVERAAAFVCKAVKHPLMSFEDYDAGYDVRGWGYTYGLQFLLDLKAAKGVPEKMKDEVEKTIKFCLDGIHQTVIPKAGGWNYARPTGRDKEAPPSPFMTGPTLQALFAAKKAGYTVDAKVVEDALKFLEAAHGQDKTVVYSGAGAKRTGKGDSVPGAMGRMCVTEVTLQLAGRGKVEDVRNAVEQFIAHWEQLDVRRMKDKTHEPPYMVAPYYFMYAHLQAAQAVELLPEAERAGYREKINKLLFSVRREDGSWNDRLFKRSGGYGTAFALLAIQAPKLPPLPKWDAPAKAAAPAAEEGQPVAATGAAPGTATE